VIFKAISMMNTVVVVQPILMKRIKIQTARERTDEKRTRREREPRKMFTVYL
jgi:hypothetical protein